MIRRLSFLCGIVVGCLQPMLASATTITLGAGEYPNGNVANLATTVTLSSNNVLAEQEDVIDLQVSDSTDAVHWLSATGASHSVTLTFATAQNLSALAAIVNFLGESVHRVSSVDFQIDTGSGFSSVGTDSTFVAGPGGIAALQQQEASVSGSFLNVVGIKYVFTPLNAGTDIRVSEVIAIPVPEPSGLLMSICGVALIGRVARRKLWVVKQNC